MLFQIFYYDNGNTTEDDKNGVLFCNHLAFYVSMFFFLLDVMHIILVDSNEQKKGFRNKFALLWFPVQLVYYSMRMKYPGYKAPLAYYQGLKKDEDQKAMVTLAILNYVLIFIMYCKLLFFMKVSQSFGTMI